MADTDFDAGYPNSAPQAADLFLAMRGAGGVNFTVQQLAAVLLALGSDGLGNVAINCTLIPGATSRLQVAGDFSFRHSGAQAFCFNQYYTDSWRSAVAGFGGAWRFDTSTGMLQWLSGSNVGAGLANGASAKVSLPAVGGLKIGQTADGIQNSNSMDLNAPGATAAFNHSGTASGWAYHAFGYNGAQIGSITQNGTTGVAFNTSSDYRLKEDLRPIDAPIERLLALKPVNFAWKADGTRTDGFIAHEVQEVIPEAVHGEKDAVKQQEFVVEPGVPAVYGDQGEIVSEEIPPITELRTVPDYQGIDQSKLVPILTAALQEVVGRVAEQDALIADLANRLAALEEPVWQGGLMDGEL